MTTAFDAAGPPPAARVPAVPLPASPEVGTAQFVGSERAFFGLVLRGSVLLMLTLGIYRFWLTTDIRRFLWGHTEIAGDVLEYTGTARELLIGFLIAIVLLVPINVLIFVGTMMPGLLPFAGALGLVLLGLLGQFAVFRARRYRLTRTIYRGVRLFQTGSAVRFALRSSLWTVLIVLTLGLAYPWATANLERYKMRHTHFGTLSGRFDGSGWRLFLRGFVPWLIVMGPLIAGIAGAATTLDWGALVQVAMSPGAGFLKLLENDSLLASAIALLAAGGGWAVLAATLLYPMFRAIVLRWWVSGLRMGGVAATSRLRNGQVYGVYARFLWYAFLFSMAAGVAGLILLAVFGAALQTLTSPASVEIGSILIGLGAYVTMMLGYSAIYQATVGLRFWRLSFETAQFTGLAALEGVEARGGPASAIGEGLADALDVGGM